MNERYVRFPLGNVDTPRSLTSPRQKVCADVHTPCWYKVIPPKSVCWLPSLQCTRIHLLYIVHQPGEPRPMLVPPIDPVTSVTIVVPASVVQTIIRLTRNPGVRAIPCGRGWIVVQTRNPCWRCGTPGAVALHHTPYTGDADAVVELCAACVRVLDAATDDV